MDAQELTPDDKRVMARFDAQAPVYRGRYREASGSGHSFRIRERRLYEMFDKAGGAVLDVGCGPGITVEHMVRQGCRFHGTDLSERMIAEGRRAFGHLPGATFSVGRVERMPFPAESFDAIICMGVVQYVADDAAAVREMARVARVGGTVFISLPNQLSPFRLWRRLVFRPIALAARALRGKRPPPAVARRDHRAGAYARLLRAHGLEPVEVAYYDVRVIPSPLDEWLPGLTVWTSERLEWLARSPLRRLAAHLIVKAVKRPPERR